jgi:hypothetical protein
MSKRNIIRVGDFAEITNPEVFVRCGYPLTTDSIIRNHMTEDDARRVDRFLNEMGVGISVDFLAGRGKEYDAVFDKIISAIARYKMSELGWGGNERTIHTRRDESLLDKKFKFKVVGKRVVQTGKRIPGWYSSYDQEGESPSFKSTGSHVILKLRSYYLNDMWNVWSNDELFEIEAKNTKKL